jgi:hypothetical protein
VAGVGTIFAPLVWNKNNNGMTKGGASMTELAAALTMLLVCAYASLETMLGRLDVQIISR